jgi:MFS family permease
LIFAVVLYNQRMGNAIGTGQIIKALLLQLAATFRSLKYRNFRLFFGGQSLSLIGTWMQQVAVSWLVYRLSDSAAALGMVAFAGQIPAFLLSPVGGMAADRFGKRRILLATQCLSMLQAAVLAVLVVSGRAEIWHLVLLNTILGTINAFDMPTRHSFVIEMIDHPDDLGNAIALNSSMFNGARLVGPAIAGLIIALWGEGPCFVINAVSYIAVIASLMMMRFTRVRAASTHGHPLAQLKEGFAYTWRFAPIKYLVVFIGLMSLLGIPYIVLLPVFAREFLGGGSQTYGMMMSAAGIGALAGGLYMASRKSVVGFEKVLVFAGAMFGTVLILFAMSSRLWVSLGLLVLAGFSMMFLTAGCNTLLQTMVDDDKRGMVLSIYIAAFIGVAPLGNLAAGFAAQHIGAHVTVLVGGAAALLITAGFARKLPAMREMIRPIYVKKAFSRRSPSACKTPPSSPPRRKIRSQPAHHLVVSCGLCVIQSSCRKVNVPEQDVNHFSRT